MKGKEGKHGKQGHCHGEQGPILVDIGQTTSPCKHMACQNILRICYVTIPARMRVVNRGTRESRYLQPILLSIVECIRPTAPPGLDFALISLARLGWKALPGCGSVFVNFTYLELYSLVATSWLRQCAMQYSLFRAIRLALLLLLLVGSTTT